jgi:hypothetical protein
VFASAVLFQDATCTGACVETKERQGEYDALAEAAPPSCCRDPECQAVEIDANYAFLILSSIRDIHDRSSLLRWP